MAQPSFLDLNNLSRYICEHRPPVEEINRRLKEIYRKKTYPEWAIVFLGFAGVSFFFTLFFGGNLQDALVAFVCGALTRVAMANASATSNASIAFIMPATKSPAITSRIELVMATPGTSVISVPIIMLLL